MTGVITGLLMLGAGSLSPVCSAFGLLTPQQLVNRADAVAVVQVPADYAELMEEPSAWAAGTLEFKVVMVLRGDLEQVVSAAGTLVDRDDYNRGLVPYLSVRPDGEGPCVARTYRPGAHYLFLLQLSEGSLTPYWAALEPTNEQLIPPFRQDPWFRWVRRQVRRDEVALADESQAAAPTQEDDWAAADIALTRLAPSEFPELPDAVIDQLDARGCTVPQGSWPARMGRNVVSGEFIEAGQKAWAVLCSVERVSAILVFDSANSLVAELGRAPDLRYLEANGDGTIAYSRMVTRASPEYVRDRHEAYWEEGDDPLPELTHDGINAGWEGKASSVRYFTGGVWLVLPGAD